jgi:hypothetical protein
MTEMLQTSELYEICDFYVDCPQCSLTRNANDFDEGDVVTCEACKIKFIVGRVE